MTPPAQITILVPVYNEEECLEKVYQEITLFLDQSPVSTEVLFVNDGSTDRSGDIISTICSRDSRFGFIELDKNRGLSTAIKAGIDSCSTELIGYMDSDNQTTPVDFLKFLPFIPEYDMVIGIRARRNDSMVKKLSSIIANWFRNVMINDGIHDTGCPLKLMKTQFAKRMPFFDGMHRFMPALVQLQQGKIKQLPVQHFSRFAGVAKYNLFNRLRKPFFDTLAFRWMRNRYIQYHIIRKSD